MFIRSLSPSVRYHSDLLLKGTWPKGPKCRLYVIIVYIYVIIAYFLLSSWSLTITYMAFLAFHAHSLHNNISIAILNRVGKCRLSEECVDHMIRQPGFKGYSGTHKLFYVIAALRVSNHSNCLLLYEFVFFEVTFIKFPVLFDTKIPYECRLLAWLVSFQ